MKKNSFAIKALIISVVVTLIYVYNFYPYITADSGDTFDHLNNVRRLLDEGHLPLSRRAYPLFFYTIAALVKVFNDFTLATVVYVILFALCSNVLQIYGIKRIFGTSDWYACLAGSALSFIWPITLKVFASDGGFTSTMLGIYLTSGATAPYHNLTYLCAKPFAMASLILFVLILKSDKKLEIKMAILLAFSMLLSVLAKPCFYQCFAPAGTIFTIGFFFNKKCKELIRCITIALAFIPATVWVVYSMSYNVTPLGFSPFESVMLYNTDGTSIPVIIIRAVIYAIFVLVAVLAVGGENRGKQLGIYALGALTFVFGLLEWIILIFPDQKWTLDTLWGYNIAMYVLFFISAGVAYSLVDKNKIVYWISNVLLCAHTVFGLLMFLRFN